MNHEEYGQGFVDGFNAALKSDYIRELYQAQDRKELLEEINNLQKQLYQITTCAMGIANANTVLMHNYNRSIVGGNNYWI